MTDKNESEKALADYYEAARRSFVARMESEDGERINLKIKIATFVIYELSHSTPSWFKRHFLSNISKNANETGVRNKKISKVENSFFNNIGDYLINMESEDDYVKKVLAPFTEEWDKKDFWKPIVFDAFLLAGIYFTSSWIFSKSEDNVIRIEQIEKKAGSGYFFQMLSESPAVI